MPKFYCPIASAESPYTAAAEGEVLEWLAKFEIYENPAQRNYFAKSHFPIFSGKSLPHAQEHLLAMPGKEALWLQSFDDVHHDEKRGRTSINEQIVFLAKLARTIEDPRSRLLLDNRWANALRDLRLELAAKATAAQVDRWVQANIDYFDGSQWEAVLRMEERVPSINEYATMWLKQCAAYPMIVFTDISCGYEVPACEWSDPRARMLREMVSILIGWDNDLTSYDKETHRAATRGFPAIQSLVSVLEANLRCSVDEAVTVAGAMRDRVMSKFVKLRDEVAAEGSATFARYAHGLGQWVRGYLDYSGQSPRYTDPYNPDDGAISAPLAAGWTVVDTPNAERSGLPELPSIAWWA